MEEACHQQERDDDFTQQKTSHKKRWEDCDKAVHKGGVKTVDAGYVSCPKESQDYEEQLNEQS